MVRWYVDASGRKYHMPCDPQDDNSQGDATRITSIGDNEDIGNPNSLPGEITVNPSNRSGKCNKCGQCCSHPAADCVYGADCGTGAPSYETRNVKGVSMHVCQYLTTGNKAIGIKNSATCSVYSQLCDIGLKGCVLYPYDPEEITIHMTNCGYYFV